MLGDPASTRRDRPIALAIAALSLATVAVGALVPAQRQPPAAQAGTVRPENDPACAEWSDGCRVCRRMPEGAACSLPGIACTPGAPQCLHRAGEP